MTKFCIDHEYAHMLSPIAMCQVLDNDRDIYGSLSILQDNLYSSVVTVRLSHIEPGEYSLMVHENPIDGTDCGSAGDPYLFGREQSEYTTEISVPEPQDRK